MNINANKIWPDILRCFESKKKEQILLSLSRKKYYARAESSDVVKPIHHRGRNSLALDITRARRLYHNVTTSRGQSSTRCLEYLSTKNSFVPKRIFPRFFHDCSSSPPTAKMAPYSPPSLAWKGKARGANIFVGSAFSSALPIFLGGRDKRGGGHRAVKIPQRE